MIVRELLIEVMAELNLDKRSPKVLNDAVNVFNRVAKRYSGKSILTAYQGEKDFVCEGDSITIGSLLLKRGRNVFYVRQGESLPDVENLVEGRDYCYAVDYESGVGVHGYRLENVGLALAWVPCNESVFCDFVPDVSCENISDILTLCKKEGSFYKKLPWVPYTNFYTDTRRELYTSKPIGENKFKLYMRGIIGKELKVIYAQKISFDENSVFEIPEAYQGLIYNAVAYNLACMYSSVDGVKKQDKKEAMETAEKEILSNNVEDRMILREDEANECDLNRVDIFVRR